jgi:hypothetical protein
MKTIRPLFLAGVITCFLSASVGVADTLFFSNGRVVSGTVLQTNGDEILLLTPHAAYNFSRSHVKEIKTGFEEDARNSNTNRLSNFKQAMLVLSKQLWATNITPIPATVIDKGIFRNVPYSSFQCGENYEVNIYGDLDHPAGIEIGFYNPLVFVGSRRSNCIRFMLELLARDEDKEALQTLSLTKDLKNRDDLTFEITPPSGDDSYNGWWISVYSANQLSLARATDLEMKNLTVSKADVAKHPREGDPAQWSANELNVTRVSIPTTITFTNKDRVVISNASVRIYETGVSIIWEKDTGAAGLVKLADLPESLRNRFGYDPIKAGASDASEKEKKARSQQFYAAQAALAAQQSQDATPAQGFGDSGYQSGGNYSGGGSVYVQGYTRSNGTYVSGYTRSR